MKVDLENDKIVILETENGLGKLMRSHRKSRDRVFILFISQWDEHCSSLVKNLFSGYTKKPKIYLVDSWNSAKAFVSYRSYFGDITRTPTLVTLTPGPPRVDDYLPNIYRALDVG